MGGRPEQGGCDVPVDGQTRTVHCHDCAPVDHNANDAVFFVRDDGGAVFAACPGSVHGNAGDEHDGKKTESENQ